MGNFHANPNNDNGQRENLAREILLLGLYQQRAFRDLTENNAKLLYEILNLKLTLDELSREIAEIRHHISRKNQGRTSRRQYESEHSAADMEHRILPPVPESDGYECPASTINQ
jgi:hypothetical protein